MYFGYNTKQQTECTSMTESLSREKKSDARPTIASQPAAFQQKHLLTIAIQL